MRASALATVQEVREKVDREADELVGTWFAEHRVAIQGLTDERQQEYEDIRRSPPSRRRGELRRPRTRIEDLRRGRRRRPGRASRRSSNVHLMSDEDGDVPDRLAERAGSARSSSSSSRGPTRSAGTATRRATASTRSAVAYRDAIGNWRSMHPDFVFFHEVDGTSCGRRSSTRTGTTSRTRSSSCRRSRTSRSGTATRSTASRRAVKDGAKWRVLDLKRADVRSAITNHTGSVLELYKPPIAVDYK